MLSNDSISIQTRTGTTRASFLPKYGGMITSIIMQGRKARVSSYILRLNLILSTIPG